jgi:hypothetical protein
MKCARCLWNTRITKPEKAKTAVTVYGGNALCLEHLRQMHASRKKEATNPWTNTQQVQIILPPARTD